MKTKKFIFEDTFFGKEYLRSVECLAKKLDKSVKWVIKNRSKIDKNIEFDQAVELYALGFDVTQLKPE